MARPVGASRAAAAAPTASSPSAAAPGCVRTAVDRLRPNRWPWSPPRRVSKTTRSPVATPVVATLTRGAPPPFSSPKSMASPSRSRRGARS